MKITLQRTCNHHQRQDTNLKPTTWRDAMVSMKPGSGTKGLGLDPREYRYEDYNEDLPWKTSKTEEPRRRKERGQGKVRSEVGFIKNMLLRLFFWRRGYCTSRSPRFLAYKSRSPRWCTVVFNLEAIITGWVLDLNFALCGGFSRGAR